MAEETKSLWGSAKPFPKHTDGTYEAVLHNLEFKKTKKEPLRDMFAWDFILPNEKHYYHNRVLQGTEASVSWAKTDFENLGIDTEDFEALLENMKKLIGSKIEIEIFTNGAFQNCKILAMLETFNEDEIPF